MQHLPDNLLFLQHDYPELHRLNSEAERLLHQDPVACMVRIRLFGEKLTERLMTDNQMPRLTENTQHRRIQELLRCRLIPTVAFENLNLIRIKGNIAAHHNSGTAVEAAELMRAAYDLGAWLRQEHGTDDPSASAREFRLPVHLDPQQQMSDLGSRLKQMELLVEQMPATIIEQMGILPAAGVSAGTTKVAPGEYDPSPQTDQHETNSEPKPQQGFSAEPTEVTATDEADITGIDPLMKCAVILPVARLYQPGMSSEEIYEVTRGYWSVAEKKRDRLQYAVAAYRGHVLEVFQITGWEAGTGSFAGKWAFSGTPADRSVRDRYLNLSLEYYRNRLAYGGRVYTECGG